MIENYANQGEGSEEVQQSLCGVVFLNNLSVFQE